jgi:flagellar biosynthesis protein FlhG
MIEEYEVQPRSGPRIWAIGGGKGGVGKSVIAANLGTSMAQMGARVALVDADLGGANLHTLLGLPTPRTNLADFISRRVANLSDIMTPTAIKNLWLVSGARALLEMANPNYGQKGKVIRHVAALDVDHVILDLGAGSAFNVLDFFLVARRGILVVVPEATSIENAHHFLKAAFFRKLKMAQPRKQVRAAIAKVVTGSTARDVRTPKNLISKIMTVDPEIGATHSARR